MISSEHTVREYKKKMRKLFASVSAMRSFACRIVY